SALRSRSRSRTLAMPPSCHVVALRSTPFARSPSRSPSRSERARAVLPERRALAPPMPPAGDRSYVQARLLEPTPTCFTAAVLGVARPVPANLACRECRRCGSAGGAGVVFPAVDAGGAVGEAAVERFARASWIEVERTQVDRPRGRNRNQVDVGMTQAREL